METIIVQVVGTPVVVRNDKIMIVLKNQFGEDVIIICEVKQVFKENI